LKQVYQYHRDIICEIFIKGKYYDKYQINSIVKIMAESGETTDNIYRTLMSNYLSDEDLSKRVLSKFTRDIVRDTPGLKDVFI
jgi:hypothetical protein